MKQRNATYQRLGDYIREVDVRNKDLKVTKLMGVNIGKFFMPSVANVIGTDLSNYKVVYRGQFASNLMHVGRDEKIPIAMYELDEPIIVSPAYFVFEVIDIDILLPSYLMMWLQRPDFDRQACFFTDGDVRGGLSKEAFLNMTLPIPPIARQREIVSEYKMLADRIRLNNSMISALESTAQALYRKMFVDNIDKAHLPTGWRIGTLGEVANISSGKTCTNKQIERDIKYLYPVAGASGVIGYSPDYNQIDKLLTTGRVGTLGVVNRYHEKIYTADNVLVIKSKYYEYCYQVLRSLDYVEITKGGVQSLITQTDLSSYEITIPAAESINDFEQQGSMIYNHIDKITYENNKLTELQSLLLAKMGQ